VSENVPRPPVAEALCALPRLRGGRDAVATARTLLDAAGCGDTLGDIERVWGLLDAAGVSDTVAADFGTVRSFDYYTGIVLEAYAPGVGLPLGGGGRYDTLLSRFGPDRPAAGFALGLERVQVALTEQGIAIPVPGAAESDTARALREAAGAAEAGDAS
jgi:ATP phosphoribosyltransferase regulatory subunit